MNNIELKKGNIIVILKNQYYNCSKIIVYEGQILKASENCKPDEWLDVETVNRNTYSIKNTHLRLAESNEIKAFINGIKNIIYLHNVNH